MIDNEMECNTCTENNSTIWIKEIASHNITVASVRRVMATPANSNVICVLADRLSW